MDGPEENDLVPADTNLNPRNSGIALSYPKTMCYEPHPAFRSTFAQPDTGQQWDLPGQCLLTPLTSPISFSRTQFS